MNKIKLFVFALCAIFFSLSASAASVVTIRVVDYYAVGLNSAGYWAGYSILDVSGTRMVGINTDWYNAFSPPPWYTDNSSWEATFYSHNDVVTGAPTGFNPSLYPLAATFVVQGLLGYSTNDNLWGAGHSEMATNTLSNGMLPPLWDYSNQVYDQQTGVKLIDVYNSMLPTLTGRDDYFVINAYSLELNTQRAGEFIVYTMATPIPPAVWLFASGLLGLVGVARRKVICNL
ncbi:MAG: hypothetical protein HZB09_01185 [Candidatus Yonathbacteria bacterium]|nr:hypothetical protein [Candidatus Yonathbacteria bacterium]